MPYIHKESRKIALRRPQTPGDLNYAITCLIRDYCIRTGNNYVSMNDVLGALEGAKLEFYRRLMAPYEDTKIQLNGDVY